MEYRHAREHRDRTHWQPQNVCLKAGSAFVVLAATLEPFFILFYFLQYSKVEFEVCFESRLSFRCFRGKAKKLVCFCNIQVELEVCQAFVRRETDILCERNSVFVNEHLRM
jgi:hypothetical protein